MRYVRIEPIVEDGRQKGFSLDADPYLNALPGLLPDLPTGAATFASDADHYFFFGRKCVKDLKMSQIRLIDASDKISIVCVFAPNQFKHDNALAIRYENVIEF